MYSQKTNKTIKIKCKAEKKNRRSEAQGSKLNSKESEIMLKDAIKAIYFHLPISWLKKVSADPTNMFKEGKHKG